MLDTIDALPDISRSLTKRTKKPPPRGKGASVIRLWPDERQAIRMNGQPYFISAWRAFTLSVCSQGNSLRPKWPYVAVAS